MQQLLFGGSLLASTIELDDLAAHYPRVGLPFFEPPLLVAHKAQTERLRELEFRRRVGFQWMTKADNGFFHSLAFTTNDFHEPIQIKARNRRVAQRACLHCHSEHVNTMLPVDPGGEMLLCIHCHGDVGHSQR